MMDKSEIWKQTRPRAIKRAIKEAKREASMSHASALMLHSLGNFQAFAVGFNEQMRWLSMYQRWIQEMDDLWGDG